MGYGNFKDLTRRTAVDKVLRDQAFNLAKNLKYDAYQGGLNKKAAGGAATLANRSAVKNENMSNKESVEELHKPITRKF